MKECVSDSLLTSPLLGLLGAIVTILVLCIASDKTNFLLRSIIILLHKPLHKIYCDNSCENSDSDNENTRLNNSVKRANASVKFLRYYNNKHKQENVIVAIANKIECLWICTQYSLLYSIFLFCFVELYGSFKAYRPFIFSVLVTFTIISTIYWLCVWLQYCFRFKSLLEEVVESGYGDVNVSEVNRPVYLRLIKSIILPISFLGASIIIAIFIKKDHSQIRIFSYYTILFAALNGIVLPFFLTYVNCKRLQLQEFMKIKWASIKESWRKSFLRFIVQDIFNFK